MLSWVTFLGFACIATPAVGLLCEGGHGRRLTCIHGNAEALALLAQEVVSWDTHSVKVDRAGGLRIPARLGLLLAKAQPRRPLQARQLSLPGITCRPSFLPCSSTHASTRSRLPKATVLQDLEALEVRLGNLKQLAAAEFTFSTRKAEMPLGPGPPVRAMTRYTSEAPPPLMKALLPYTGG